MGSAKAAEVEYSPSFREDLEYVLARVSITTTDMELCVARLRAAMQPKVEPDDLTMLRLARGLSVSMISSLQQHIDETHKMKREAEQRREYTESLIQELLAKSKNA